MSWIKVLAINVLLTLALIGLLLLTPPLIFGAYDLISGDTRGTRGSAETGGARDPRGGLALYRDYDWAATHFREAHQLNTTYYDFVTWRRDDYSGETINIAGGIRDTVDGAGAQSGAETFWFFGGSTTWGTGVSDAFTYPSIFSVTNGVRAKNFGETGYIARQSLAYLANMLAADSARRSLKGVHAVFYDGVNDVSGRCRSEVDGLGTTRQPQIRKFVADGSAFDKWGLTRTFGQVIDLLKAVLLRVDGAAPVTVRKHFSCADDPGRAWEVAETLVNTWQVAADLVAARGGRFTAILQPVAYLGHADTSYLALSTPRDRELAQQYAAVYPLIREIASARDIDFIDLSSAYDGCDTCYIDFCHVGPQAHEQLVRAMSAHFFP